MLDGHTQGRTHQGGLHGEAGRQAAGHTACIACIHAHTRSRLGWIQQHMCCGELRTGRVAGRVRCRHVQGIAGQAVSPTVPRLPPCLTLTHLDMRGHVVVPFVVVAVPLHVALWGQPVQDVGQVKGDVCRGRGQGASSGEGALTRLPGACCCAPARSSPCPPLPFRSHPHTAPPSLMFTIDVYHQYRNWGPSHTAAAHLATRSHLL